MMIVSVNQQYHHYRENAQQTAEEKFAQKNCLITRVLITPPTVIFKPYLFFSPLNKHRKFSGC